MDSRNAVASHVRSLRDERLPLLVGTPDFRLLHVYLEGYRACLRDAGIEDDYPEFLDWLIGKNPSVRVRGWAAVVLEQVADDHQAALRLFADEAATFLGSQRQRPPPSK